MKTMKLQILKESYEFMKNTTSAKFQPSVFIFPCSLLEHLVTPFHWRKEVEAVKNSEKMTYIKQ